MPVTVYGPTISGRVQTIISKLLWGHMWEASEAPIAAATKPAAPTYDSAETGAFACTSQAVTGTATDIWWTLFRIPDGYVEGSDLTLKVDGIYVLGGDAVHVAATLDAEVFPYDAVAGDFSNADICATVAQDLANAWGTETFTLTGTGLKPGRQLLIRLTSVVQITSAVAGTGQNSFNNPRIEYAGVK